MVEVIVVMILSVITMATIYTVYVLVKKQFYKQSKKIESLNYYLQLKNTLVYDFRNADSVKTKTEFNEITCYRNTDTIIYFFTEKIILRNQNGVIDSFTLFPHNLKISVHETSQLVNGFEVEIVPFADTILLEIKKEYDSNCLIKYN